MSRRSPEVRKLERAIQDADGDVYRLQGGKLRIVGPLGSVTIGEPDDKTVNLIEDRTGLKLESA